MTVSFFGMMGPNGPLPLHMTEYARDRMRNSGDHVLVRFFDIFHHRMLSLFYRAWARNQQTVSHDRAADSAAEGPGSSRVVHDRFAMYIASMIGRGERSALNRDDVSDLSKLYYSGRLASSTRNSEGLAAILSSYFSVPCKIEPFVGQWIDLPEESKCHLGRSQETGTLGMTAIVGSRVWDVQSKFRIRLGPMDFETFSSLLPASAGIRNCDLGCGIIWMTRSRGKHAWSSPEIEFRRFASVRWENSDALPGFMLNRFHRTLMTCEFPHKDLRTALQR